MTVKRVYGRRREDCVGQQTRKLGKDSFFDRWWYFDTNCLSVLVKLAASGHATPVQKLVGGRDILLTSASLQELRKAPVVLQSLPDALETANLFVLPDMTKFWYTDLANFLNVERISMNTLEVHPLPPGLLNMVTDTRQDEFEQACAVSEADVAERYFGQVGPDIGADLDERDLCVHICDVVQKHAQEWFHIDILPADCNAANFPSFYVLYYAYYFRYVKNSNVRHDTNDFIDLVNCLATPYCEKYFCEATFAHILREYVQGRRPPTSFQIAKKLYRKGLITQEVYRVLQRNKARLSRTASLLDHTEIVTYTEMRLRILQQ